MTLLRLRNVGALEEAVGTPLGPGSWHTVGPSSAESFAGATGRGTPPDVVDGLLTLSLLPRLVNEMRTVENVRMGVNYGPNRVRFPAAVPMGARVRARAVIIGVERLPGDAAQVVTRVVVGLEDSVDPACTADLVVRYYFAREP
ncbi:3-hydroxyacyl-thioester dehydratase HtdZ [Pseudonocardia ailaonensis]|uniref:3-hydroxyacyl-thioester dehydratase HtdZ n=1 Tax=Pseudonocardia ailaonensis TaxID=367279 RepID=A0ABN2N7I5_9PSEU